MKSNEINQNNVWYQLGRLVGTTITDNELDNFLKKNNLYTTINSSSNSSFKKGTFEKLIDILDEKNIDTSDVKTLFLEWNNVENSNIKGYDRYSFYWGYDISKLSEENVDSEGNEWVTTVKIEEKYNLAKGSIRRDIHRQKFADAELKKVGRDWTVNMAAADKLYSKK